MKVDVHNHAIPEESLELMAREPGYGVEVRDGRWLGGVHVDFPLLDSFVRPEAKLAELDALGLDGAVISAAPPLFNYHVRPEAGEEIARATNRGLERMCAAAPERLRWLATVPLQDPRRAAAVLEECAAAGCVGVEVGTSTPERRLDDPALQPFWQAAERLGLPVTLHPAYNEPNRALAPYYLDNVIGNQLETTVAVERLICAGMLDDHPGLQLVLVHAGGYFPWQAGRLRHARTVRPELAESPPDPWRYLDRLWFDSITHDAQVLAFLVERVGVSRVVLGSDLPFDMATPDPLGALTAAVGQATATAVAEHNPASLYPDTTRRN